MLKEQTHLLTALGYTACERGITVRFTRVIDMINRLNAAPGDRPLHPRMVNSS
ncbi:MAG: ATP-binding protein [Planctomycetaceae bacterium]